MHGDGPVGVGEGPALPAQDPSCSLQTDSTLSCGHGCGWSPPPAGSPHPKDRAAGPGLGRHGWPPPGGALAHQGLQQLPLVLVPAVRGALLQGLLLPQLPQEALLP